MAHASVLAASLAGIVSAPSAQTFTKVTDPSNPIVTDSGPSGNSYFGASWIDVDGDGDDDLFIDQTQLYRNNGGGSFTKLLGTGIGSAQVTNPTFNMDGNSWADYDNDGDLDAFLAGEHSSLYVQEAGIFTRVAGGDIGDSTATAGWSAAWADYDNDGALDLAITHPAHFIPGPVLENHLFHSSGAPDYTLVRVTTGPIVTGQDAYTVGTWADHDDDGDQDYFIGSGTANGVHHPDNLYRNLLTETGIAEFERITDAPIATDLQDGQVWNWIDYDNDRDLDGFLTNYGGPTGLNNRLYRQNADGSFTNISDEITTDVAVSLGSVWQDFDNDGDLDCFTATDGPALDHYYRNNGNGTFTEDNSSVLKGSAVASRSATAADYDDDGDVDLFVLAPGTARSLYRNDTANGNHWLEIRLRGVGDNRSAIGAKVKVKAVIAGVPVWMRRDVSAQNQFNGHHSLRQHFGLGGAQVADSVRVEWPSGGVDVWVDVAADQRLDLVQGIVSSGPAMDPAGQPRPPMVVATPNPATGAVVLRLRGASSSVTTLDIADAGGRRVHRLEFPAGAENAAVAWDGRDAYGRSMPAGVYAYTVSNPSGRSSGHLVLVR